MHMSHVFRHVFLRILITSHLFQRMRAQQLLLAGREACKSRHDRLHAPHNGAIAHQQSETPLQLYGIGNISVSFEIFSSASILPNGNWCVMIFSLVALSSKFIIIINLIYVSMKISSEKETISVKVSVNTNHLEEFFVA